jgi:Fe-S cluster assembly protein SufD
MKTLLVEAEKKMDFNLKEDTQYVLSFPEFSPKKSYKISLNFVKEGVHGEVLALFRLKEGQAVDLTTESNHQAPHTYCNTAVRGVLGDESSANYVGKIIIGKKAQQTNSYLEDNILVVGDNVKNTSEPILEIEADDVRASHGATTGRIGFEQLYYLQSRGLSKQEAESLIVEGFFASLLSTIEDEKIREQIKKTLYV